MANCTIVVGFWVDVVMSVFLSQLLVFVCCSLRVCFYLIVSVSVKEGVMFCFCEVCDECYVY